MRMAILMAAWQRGHAVPIFPPRFAWGSADLTLLCSISSLTIPLAYASQGSQDSPDSAIADATKGVAEPSGSGRFDSGHRRLVSYRGEVSEKDRG